MNIYIGSLSWDDTITWKKSHPEETGFLICKNEILFVKNIPPSRDGVIFICN